MKIMRSIFFLSLFLSSAIATAASSSEEESFFLRRSVEKELSGLGAEKFSHLRVYWHDVLNGENATSIIVVPPVSESGFGKIRMIDNALTVAPSRSSKLWGRAQGLYADPDQTDTSAFMMAMNFAITSGEFKGSSISIFGRNPWKEEAREMSVIGGSGLFKMARGFVRAHTVELDVANGNAVVEYNIYLLHYEHSMSSF